MVQTLDGFHAAASGSGEDPPASAAPKVHTRAPPPTRERLGWAAPCGMRHSPSCQAPDSDDAFSWRPADALLRSRAWSWCLVQNQMKKNTRSVLWLDEDVTSTRSRTWCILRGTKLRSLPRYLVIPFRRDWREELVF